MRSNAVALLLGLTLGCAHRPVELGDVHPGVFAMAPCWLSDAASPVVTEVNLDAAATNRNQFGEVTRDGAWVRVETDDGRGFMGYYVLESRPPRYRILYEENGGGTLTTSNVLEIEVCTRVLEIDGVETAVRVMRILSISGMARNGPRQPTRGERASRGIGTTGSAPSTPIAEFEMIDLGDGCTITVEGDDHVTIPGEGESWFYVNGYGYRESVEFMAEFQARVRARDREALVDVIAFPLRVNGATILVVEDREALLRRLDQVFTAETMSAILAADARRVSCSWRGIMIGHGVVWAVKYYDGRFAVCGINQP